MYCTYDKSGKGMPSPGNKGKKVREESLPGPRSKPTLGADGEKRFGQEYRNFYGKKPAKGIDPVIRIII